MYEKLSKRNEFVVAVNPKIKFSKNWNNKLCCDYFTTIRLHDDSKWNYYTENISTDDSMIYWDVLLKLEKKFEALLVDARMMKLKDIPEWVTLIDAGMYKDDFVELMTEMYSKKPQWASGDTVFMILCFKKMQQTLSSFKK